MESLCKDCHNSMHLKVEYRKGVYGHNTEKSICLVVDNLWEKLRLVSGQFESQDSPFPLVTKCSKYTSINFIEEY